MESILGTWMMASTIGPDYLKVLERMGIIVMSILAIFGKTLL